MTSKAVEADDARHKRGKRRSTAVGSGYLYEAANAFHVRYYTQEVGEDGRLHRIQKSKMLCKKDLNKHRNIGSKGVGLLRQQFMAKINAAKPSAGDMQITLFWDRFIKYCSEVRKDGKPRRRANTVRAYKAIFKKRLEHHFGKLKLSEYEPEMGTRYLDSLSASLGLRTLRLYKAIASTLFQRAVAEGRIKINPWRSVKLPEDAMTNPTDWYTLDEYEQMMEVLKEHLNLQLAFAIGCYCGLRRGEIEGLKWEDFEGNVLHITRAVSFGVIGLPKTESSIAPVIVPSQVAIFLTAWWEKQNKPKEGWVFPCGKLPVDLNRLARRIVIPAIEKANEDREKKIKWKTWQACRRTCVTWIIENTRGNAALAQAQARHKSMSTTLDIYKKAITRDAHQNGILLEAFPQPKLLKN